MTTPTSDLRDRIAEAEHRLYPGVCSWKDWRDCRRCAERADAVTAAVQPALDERDREITRLRAELADRWDRDQEIADLRRDLNGAVLNSQRAEAARDAAEERARTAAAERQAAWRDVDQAEREREGLTTALATWQPEHDRARERADRKGYSHDETEAEVYAMAINTVTKILAALDHLEEP